LANTDDETALSILFILSSNGDAFVIHDKTVKCGDVEQEQIVSKFYKLIFFCDQLEQDLENQETNSTNLSMSMTSCIKQLLR